MRPAVTADGRPARPSDDLAVRCLPSGRRLPADTVEWLVAGLVDALPSLKMRELFELRRDMLTDADYIVATVDTSRDQVVGLLTSRWVTLPSRTPCLHVMVQFVGEKYRHGTVFRRSWSRHFSLLLAEGRPFPDVLALKTYNPVAYCAMLAFSGHPDVGFFPGGGTAPEAGLRRLAAEVAATVSPGHAFDPETGVISGVGVPTDLYPALPVSTMAAVNEHFARNVRPGDRVLCLLHVPTSEGCNSILAALGLPEDGLRTPVAAGRP